MQLTKEEIVSFLGILLEKNPIVDISTNGVFIDVTRFNGNKDTISVEYDTDIFESKVETSIGDLNLKLIEGLADLEEKTSKKLSEVDESLLVCLDLYSEQKNKPAPKIPKIDYSLVESMIVEKIQEIEFPVPITEIINHYTETKSYDSELINMKAYFKDLYESLKESVVTLKSEKPTLLKETVNVPVNYQYLENLISSKINELDQKYSNKKSEKVTTGIVIRHGRIMMEYNDKSFSDLTDILVPIIRYNIKGMINSRISNVGPGGYGGGGPGGGSPGGASSWGDLTGVLSDQTDLQLVLNGKQATLVSGSTIKTINGITLLGSGDIAIAGGSGSTDLSYNPTTRLLSSSSGADTTLPLANTSTDGLMVASDKVKLDGIAPAATVNATDASLRDRSTHTGTQPVGTITGLAPVATSGSATDLTVGTLPAGRFDDTSHGSRSGGTLHSEANTTVAGFISSSDKVKLDGIANNANAYVHPNHTGDVTSTGDGATVISPGVVTNAKLANVGTQTIKGRTTAAIGAPEDLTAAQVKTLLGVVSTDISDFNEAAQDAIGAMVNTSLIYTDATPSLARAALTGAITAPVGSNATSLGSFTTAQLNTALSDNDVVTGGGTASGTNTGDQTIILTGPITGTGTGSFATTITDDAVTNTKLANMLTQTFKGRITAATGDPEDLTIAQAKTMLNLTGTNSGDQTAITGITGTKAQFDTAVTDGNFQFVGDAPTTHTHIAANITDFSIEVDARIGAASINALNDVILTTPGTGQVLKYNGTNWINDTDLAGGVTDGDKGDITVTASGLTWTIDAGVVSNSKLATAPANTIKGNNTAGIASPSDLTGTQVTALLDNFTSTLRGLAPASGGGTTNYLRADGTWGIPPGGGGVTDGDKGDITVTASGLTWTIDAGVVSLSKLADLATSTILGRATAGTGVPEALTVVQVKTLLNLAGTNSGDQTITLTGPVTGSGTGSFTTAITDNSITNVILADMAANTVKVRAATTLGDPSDLSLASSQLLGRGSTGDIAAIVLGNNLTMTGTTLNTTGTAVFTGDNTGASDVAPAMQTHMNSNNGVLILKTGIYLMNSELVKSPGATQFVVRALGDGPVILRHPHTNRVIRVDNSDLVSAAVPVTAITRVLDNTTDFVNELTIASLPTGAVRNAFVAVYSSDIHFGEKSYKVTSITNSATPVVTTARPHLLTAASTVVFDRLAGGTWSTIKHNLYSITAVTATTFQIVGLNTTTLGTYTTDSALVSDGTDYGFLGEGSQIMELNGTIGIRLHGTLKQDTRMITNVAVRVLPSTFKVDIQGLEIQPSGDSFANTVRTSNAEAIQLTAVVGGRLKDLTFTNSWSTGIRIQACMAMDVDNLNFNGAMNKITVGAFGYGYMMYGMNYAHSIGKMGSRQLRHMVTSATSQGNVFNGTTWYNHGQTRRVEIDDLTSINSHGTAFDTHEPIADFHIKHATLLGGYNGPEDESGLGGGFSSRGCDDTIDVLTVSGFRIGVYLQESPDHGIPNTLTIGQLILEGHPQNDDLDVGVRVYTQVGKVVPGRIKIGSLIAKNVGRLFQVDAGGILECGPIHAAGIDAFGLFYGGSKSVFSGGALIDYSENPNNAAPFSGCLMFSDAVNGGPRIAFTQRPTIKMGNASNKPAALFVEQDTIATKHWWAPGLTVINPQGVTPTALLSTAQTTLAQDTQITDATGGVGVTDGDKGDITVTATGATWTIDPGVVSNTKLATVSSQTIKGRTTAATGAPEDLTPAQVRTMLNVADGSTANATDASLRDRTTHTGTQPAGTITGLASIATSGSATDLSVGTLPAARFDDTAHGIRAGGTLHSTANTTTAGFISSADQVKLNAITGTNTGDQTSIVGITGTKAQFNTSVSDGDILYVGDVSQYTDEMAQDAVGLMIDASLTYVDATPLLQRAALTGDITAPAGSNATTLATVNATVGSFGLAGSVSQFTVTAKGLITSAVNVAINIASTAISDSTAAGRAFLTAATVAAQTALLNVFLPSGVGSAKGLVPDPGVTAGTTRFLREDATWVVPPVGGGVTDGDKGDITVTATGATWTIDNGVITLAKQADVATGTVFYRKTAATGAPEVQTLATLKTDLGLTGTNSGDQTITLTSDVTGTGAGSFATTIAPGVVTLAKQANLAANSLIGNSTGISATPTAVPMSSGPTASSVATRDANANMQHNNSRPGYTTTATAGAVTTLTVASTYLQFFTGAATQTVTLPDVTTLVQGHQFYIRNLSSGLVTINSSGGNAVLILAPNTRCIVTCILLTGTTAASWSGMYIGLAITSGKMLNISNTLTLSGTDGNSLSINSASASVSNSNTGDQTITLTGDVTGTGTGSFATTITDDAVTNIKLANVNSATFKGRITAAAGDPEDLTGTQATTLLDLASPTAKGLGPIRSGVATEYLSGTGVYSIPPGGASVTVQDEGANITTALSTLNFVGGGVTVSGGATSVITIPSPPASVVASRIYRNTNQSIPTGAGYTSLSWTTAGYETGGDFWTSGSTVTIPETGLYQVTSEGTFDTTGLLAVTTCNMQLLVNGVSIIGEDEAQVAINAKGSLFVFAQRNFTAGDTILTQVKHSDAGSVNIMAQGDHSPDIILAKVGGAIGPDVGDGDKGDITVSASGTTWRVDPNIKVALTLVLSAGAFNL